MAKEQLLNAVDKHAGTIIGLAQDMWENPEIGYEETYATKISRDVMENAGFSIHNIAGIETGFYAEYGSGHPIIGILGEHDALPGLSQEVLAKQKPVEEGGAGHGCGHNLIGAGSMGGCIALKEIMEAEGIKGTIRYYGCPAEEILSGKTWMATKGVFNDLDICFGWHPMTVTSAPLNIDSIKVNASVSVEFFFKGISSHAGVSPELGRSALDAMEIMNIGANYLREHTRDFTRMHYAPTSKVTAPNIVPAEASVWYFVRAPKKAEVHEVFERLIKCAEGAATMTETEMSYEIKADCYDLLGNETLQKVMNKNLSEVGPVIFDEADKQFAKEIVESGTPAHAPTVKALGLDEETYLHEGILPMLPVGGAAGGSTDVGDVSNIVPTAQFINAASPLGVPNHSWQSTASFGSTIAHKAVVHASKVLAFSAYEALTDGGEIVRQAREEFEAVKVEYVTKLPADFNPYKQP